MTKVSEPAPRRKPGPHLFGAVSLFLAALVYLYDPIVRGLVTHWREDENYSHGFLIVPLAMYFAWTRRHAWAAATTRPSSVGLLVVALSLCLLTAGVAAAELFLARVSFIGVLAGAVVFLFGAPRLRLMAFPLAFLLLMIPPPEILFNQVTLPLQLFASRTGEVLLRGAGVPLVRDGNVLELVSMKLEVAKACSGIRSIVSLLTFAVVLGELGGGSSHRRLLLMSATLPIAIGANAARVTVTGLAAEKFGGAAADELLHTILGLLVFVLSVVGLLLVERATRWPRMRLRARVVQ